MIQQKTRNASFNSSAYRLCVGIMLLNQEGKVFVGKRWNENGEDQVPEQYCWQMPQGGIDAGEEPYAAALRELYEETSVRSVKLLAEAPEWYFYDLPAIVTGRSWKGKFKGQKQRWFAFRFTGDESEINTLTPGDGKQKPEFESWRWEEMKNLPNLIIPFKRDVYKKVVAVFSHLV